MDDGNGGAFAASSISGTTEIQKIVDNGATGGTFTISHLGVTSGAITLATGSDTDVKSALEGMMDARFTPSRQLFPHVEITRSGSASSYEWTVTFVRPSGNVPTLTLNTAGVTGTLPTVTVLAEGAGTPDIQEITTTGTGVSFSFFLRAGLIFIGSNPTSALISFTIDSVISNFSNEVVCGRFPSNMRSIILCFSTSSL